MNVITLALLLLLYVLPIIVATQRKHRSATAIGLVNVFLGWTAIGWLWALIWAFTGNINTDDAACRVRCPECKELVIEGAKKCKHCGSALLP